MGSKMMRKSGEIERKWEQIGGKREGKKWTNEVENWRETETKRKERKSKMG